MFRPSLLIAGLFTFLILLASSVCGQLGGSRAGAPQRGSDGPASTVSELPLMERETAEGYIAIDGRAETRVRATAIRIVLAVTTEGETADGCRRAIDERIQQLKKAWMEAGVSDEQIVEDFIAVLPQYAWRIERQDGVEVGVEKKTGYRMQTNVHVEASGESKAQEVLRIAMSQGITDIIAFDYWNSDLDQVKKQVRQAAVEAARAKADVLLGAVFEDRPQPINVQEQTTVRYPEALYHSFTNAYAETVTPSIRRDIPFIRASRPQNTYYRGLYSNADVQPGELPMNPELSVVSTVRIYYRSPAADLAASE